MRGLCFVEMMRGEGGRCAVFVSSHKTQNKYLRCLSCVVGLVSEV